MSRITIFRYFVVSLRNVYYKVFRKKTLGVVGVILKDGSVCLVRHSYTKGWYLPGGGICGSETPYQALVREVYEETGVLVKSARLMNVFSSFKGGWSNYVLCYLIDHFEIDQYATLDSEIAEAKFFEVTALPHDIRLPAKRRITEAITNVATQDPMW